MKRLTKDQQEAIIDLVHKQGQQRAAAQGLAFREEDYIAGAMAAFYATGTQDRLPAAWVFGVMLGGSPCGIDSPERDQFQRAVRYLPELLAAAWAVVSSNGETDLRSYQDLHPDNEDACVDMDDLARLQELLKRLDKKP